MDITRRSGPIKTGTIAVILFAVFTAAVALWFAYELIFKRQITEIPTSVLVLLGILAATALAAKAMQVNVGSIELELAPVREERKAIQERISSQRGGVDIGGIIELGLNQMTEYYTINKSQARNSFRASMGAVVVGFLAITSGIALHYRQPQLVAVPTLSAIGGVLLQFIGGAYFYLYNRSLQQVNFFYETLLRLQDTMLAIQQADRLENQARDAARQLIIKSLLRAPVAVPQIVETPPTARKPKETKPRGTAGKKREKAQAATQT